MEIWKATIKERGNEHIITTTYSCTGDMFGHIVDKRIREYETRKYLKEFWGLDDDSDVEWYKLEKENEQRG